MKGVVKLKQGRILPFPMQKNIKIENSINTSNVVIKNAEEEVFKVNEDHEKYGNITEELNSPLNIVHGNIQLMEMLIQNEVSTSKSRLTRSIHSVKQNCYKLTKLLNNMIDLQKIRDRQFYLCYNTVNIVEVVENTVVNANKLINNKIVFDTNVEEKILQCDLGKVQKSILILLSNAVNFSNDEKITVDLNVEENIEIAIMFKSRDSKHLNFLMDKMDKLKVESIEDISVGFHICKHIVGLHNGRIEMGGTEDEIYFTINLPYESRDNIHYLYTKDKIFNNENLIERVKVEFSDNLERY